MLQHADELSLLQAQIVYKKKLDSVMRELTAQEAVLLEKAARLKEILLREEKDVERLEKPGLSVFFYQLTGQMESVMDKERRELYTARVKYQTILRELEAVQEDIRETREDLEDLSCCEELYAQKLEQQRRTLELLPDSRGITLLEKERSLAYLTQQAQELDEAVVAGTAALRNMAELKQILHSAKDWTGSESKPSVFWADHARQEKLQEAREQVAQLQVLMQRFNKELSDVTIRPELQNSICQMLQFADQLYSDLSLDLTVMERIRHACLLADQTREYILGVLRQLQNAMEEVRHKQTRTRQEMDNMILQAVNEDYQEELP